MLEDFAASIQEEGTRIGGDAFENLGSSSKTDETMKEGFKPETSSASPADNKPKTDEPSQGGTNTPALDNVPFHKHPRWIENQKELKELRNFRNEEYPKLVQLVQEKLSKPQDSTPQIPGWFSGIYGNDAAKWQEYQTYEAGVRAQIKQELVNEQVQESQRAQAEETRWSKWVDDSLQNLEDEGLTFDKNELQKIALEYLPSDEDGNIDFRKAYNIMQELKKVQAAPQKAQVDAKKAVADMTGGKQRAEKTPPKFETPASLRNKSWGALLRD